MVATQSNGPSRQEGDYEYFALRTSGLMLLSEEQQLVVDHVNETVTLVDWKEQPPRFVRSCTIFEEDLQLLCPLLGAWPAMVPYARLVALMAGPELAQQVEEAQSARDDKELDTLLEPLRADLEPCAKKLETFGLTIVMVSRGGFLVIDATGKE